MRDVMASPRRLIAGSVVALALGAPALLATTANSRGTGFDLKVSKHEDGPFRELARLSVNGNQTRSATWLAKSKSDNDQGMRLFSAADDRGYRIKWFRGDKNITEEVEDSPGYKLTLKGRTSKLFTVEVKRGEAALQNTCVEASLADQSLVFSDLAVVGVNTDPEGCL